MQSIQDFLTTTIVVLCATITITMALDLSIKLTQLWNNVAKNKVEVQQVYPQLENANRQQLLLTATDIKTVSIPADFEAPLIAHHIDIESLELLIQKLPQSRARTAARRLGIKDKVDGSYQKVGILREQISAKLKSQPSEVERVLDPVTLKTSTSKQEEFC
jgi:DNA polymerase III gamma/tau subunit